MLRATIEDLLAIPVEERFHEVVLGHVVRKADASGARGGAQADLIGLLGAAEDRDFHP